MYELEFGDEPKKWAFKILDVGLQTFILFLLGIPLLGVQRVVVKILKITTPRWSHQLVWSG